MIATHNPGKLAEMRELLAPHGVEAISAGDLGRPHRVEGVVVPGQRRGRALGFPTANLETYPYTAIPADDASRPARGPLISTSPTLTSGQLQAGQPASRSIYDGL